MFTKQSEKPSGNEQQQMEVSEDIQSVKQRIESKEPLEQRLILQISENDEIKQSNILSDIRFAPQHPNNTYVVHAHARTWLSGWTTNVADGFLYVKKNIIYIVILIIIFLYLYKKNKKLKYINVMY